MSILNALKQQSSSIDDLAKLPQAMIMQMAQKKQISQDMLAPILARKAEMMDAVSRSKALQQPAPQLSVMEQIMAKNIEAENPANTVPAQPQAMPQAPQDAGVAQLPIPERQYAGGGIVAFAKGDLVDEDDEIDVFDDYARAASAARQSNAMPAFMASDAQESTRNMPTQNAGVGLRYTEPMPTGGSKGINYKGGKHPYESLVVSKAQEFGVDPMLASYILNKETGGMKNPENARSSAGAMGIAQFMPATAKQYGINPDIPEEAAIGMGKHLRYLMDKYDDPKLAAIAYNWGEGNTNKWLKAGADMDKLPKETKKYVASLAGGGEVDSNGVERFQAGGSKEPRKNPTEFEADLDIFGNYLKKKQERFEDSISELNPFPALRDYFKKPISRDADAQIGGFYGGTAAKPVVVPPASTVPPVIEGPGLTADEMIAGSSRAGTFDGVNKDTTSGIPIVSAPREAVPKTNFELFMEQNDLDRAALGKQRKEDQNMALLAAGLGMLGGGSQYAFENIGKGGLSGVQYLSEANKQRAAEKAALDKNRVAAAHYENIGKYYNSQTLSKDERAELQRQKLTEDKIKSARDDYFQYQKMVEEGFIKQYPLAAVTPDDPTTIKLKQEWMAKHSPILESLRASAYPNLPKLSSSSALQSQADAIINPKKGN
jgi:soluble lytic murein transglycosylase-like protein